MHDRDLISQRLQDHYEAEWRRGDPWSFADSPYEQRRYARLLETVSGRTYDNVLEIGCGSGCFSCMLAPLAGRLVALDVAAAAVERARRYAESQGVTSIEWQVADAMRFELGNPGQWDLIVLSETIYSLGWLYPFFDIGWFATRLHQSMGDGGRLLLANTYGRKGADWLLQSHLIDTYHDLFSHVGFQTQREIRHQDEKDGVAYSIRISLMSK